MKRETIWLYRLFMKIAEPRTIRVLQFFIYLGMASAGVGIIRTTPWSLEGIVGEELVHLLGIFMAVGSALGAGAVLPGIWWLERVGIMALCTGLLMYLVIVISLGASPVGIAVSATFILTFVQRWLEIKGSQLAPRKD